MVTLSVNEPTAMLFVQMTGEKGKAQTRIKDGKLQVYLQLQSGESVIIQTFDHPVETQAWKYIQEQPVSLSLDHDWDVAFCTKYPRYRRNFRYR